MLLHSDLLHGLDLVKLLLDLVVVLVDRDGCRLLLLRALRTGLESGFIMSRSGGGTGLGSGFIMSRSGGGTD
jgi:hypothetical protein